MLLLNLFTVEEIKDYRRNNEDENGASEQTKFHQQKTIVSPTELRTNPIYIAVYINWMYLVVMYIIPFSTLLILNLR